MLSYCIPCSSIQHAASVAHAINQGTVKMGKDAGIWYIVVMM